MAMPLVTAIKKIISNDALYNSIKTQKTHWPSTNLFSTVRQNPTGSHLNTMLNIFSIFNCHMVDIETIIILIRHSENKYVT